MRSAPLAALIAFSATAPLAGQREQPETISSSRPSDMSPAAPEWARQYTEGLRAWRDLIDYWLDRQRDNGTFGFGWGEDCEMIVGWPGVMMAADDKRIYRAIERLADCRWYNPNIQQGYLAQASDPEHGPEPISYTTPTLLYQNYGSPKLIERLMVTASNVEHWTRVTPRGDRHMRSTYFGSQQMREWPFYNEDSPINARAWIPMTHLLLYNRDPYLMKYYVEWTSAWARHAMADVYGKPPGILPGSVSADTGEPGGHTHNWWGAGAHDFSSLWYQTRLHGMLVVSYVLTGDDQYITPLREMLRFFSTWARPAVNKGETLPPDRLPDRYTYPEGWRDGDASTRWARDLALGHPGCWYYYVTGDTQFDDAFSRLLNIPIQRGPFDQIDKTLVERGYRRALSFRDQYFEKVVPRLKYGGSTANYAAAWWQKQYGTMTFGQRCFRDGGRLANSVNWPWVDFPIPSVVWKDTGYHTAIFVLDDRPGRFRVALCNVSNTPREIGAQLFTLDEGTYVLRLGRDPDENAVFDAVVRTDRIHIRRGSIVRIELEPDITMMLELERAADSDPVPEWHPLPDLGLDEWDVMAPQGPPRTGHETSLMLRIHNIGSAPARDVTIEVAGLNGKQVVWTDSVILPHIDPPQQLAPSFVDVSAPWPGRFSIDAIRVRIDPDNDIDELYEGNNAVVARIDEIKTAQPEKRAIEHQPATRPSLADVPFKHQSRYDIPFREGIQLDGIIHPDEWAGVAVFELLPHSPDSPLRRQTRMQIAYDHNALSMALWCEEPHLERLDTDLQTITDIYYNDGFEIFIDPDAQVWRYWQFVFDTVPHTFQTLTRNQYASKAEWDVMIHKGDGFWSAEVRFPFSSFDVDPPGPGSRWRMNVMRFVTTIRDPEQPDRPIRERSHFSPAGKLHSHHEVTLFGDVYFEAAQPDPAAQQH